MPMLKSRSITGKLAKSSNTGDVLEHEGDENIMNTEQTNALPDAPPDAGGALPIQPPVAVMPPTPPELDGVVAEPSPEPVATPAVSAADVLAAIQSMGADDVQQLLTRAQVVPTTMGMTPEQFATIMQTNSSMSARAMQQSLRHENPSFPNKSVFLERGKFDDEGHPQLPKERLKYDTYFVGVLIGRAGAVAESNTEEEIQLFNRFVEGEDKESRDGKWTAKFTKRGTRTGLFIDVPCLNNDDRIGLPPQSEILMELLDGADAVNPASLMQRVLAGDAEVKALRDRIALLERAEKDTDIQLTADEMERRVAASA